MKNPTGGDGRTPKTVVRKFGAKKKPVDYYSYRFPNKQH